MSQIRCELADKLKIDQVEKTLFNSWSDYIKNQDCITTDATCYESEVRNPTDQKLLWESVSWSYHQMKSICKELKLKLPRTKYLKWKGRYIGYSKMRRKTHKKRTPLTRALLHLLKKINKELNRLEKDFDFEKTAGYYKRRDTIKKIHTQHQLLFTTGEKPKNRIVSIDKDYLRPIVRGKEIKPVEPGLAGRQVWSKSE